MATATFTAFENASHRLIRVLAGEVNLDAAALANSATVQAALSSAKEKYGHALCKCRPPGLKLQIRQRSGKLHLAVWPSEGEMHDGNCLFYREELPVVESSLVAHIAEDERQRRVIHLNFDIDRDMLRDAPAHVLERVRMEQAQAPNQASSLKGLMHLLWADAQLTTWHPTWNRDWGRTRFQLMNSALNFRINGVNLNERLFVPRPFRADIQEDLVNEWKRFTYHLRSSHEVARSGIIIAPVKGVELSPRGALIRFRQFRERLGISRGTFDALWSNYKTLMSRIEMTGDMQDEQRRSSSTVEQPEVIAIARVEINTRGQAWARCVHLMGVHPKLFIPANNADEVMLIDALRAASHQFSRLLSSEKASVRLRPLWTVRHVIDPLGRPVERAAIEIIQGSSSPDLIQTKMQLAQALERNGVPLLVWCPSGSVGARKSPDLFPNDRLNRFDAARALDVLRDSSDVTYAYGSGLMNRFIK